MKLNASYSTLCTDQLLEQVAPLYEIGTPTSCEFWSRGLNDSYKLASDSGSFLLRVYRKGWRTRPDIKFEMNAIQYLQDNQAKVANPIRKIDGDYVTSISAPEGERFVILTHFIEGTPLAYDELRDATLFGKAAADVHSRSTGFESSHDRYQLDQQHLIEEPLSHILPFMSHRPDDQAFLEHLSKTLLDRFAEAESNALDYGFCHGDFHGFNAHEHQGDIYHFDFDCCGFGFRMFDLATFNWSARLRKKEDEWWPNFLEGYRSERSVSDADLSHLEAFVAIRDLWLFGLHIGNAHDFAKGWLDDAYIDRRIEFLKASFERMTTQKNNTDI